MRISTAWLGVLFSIFLIVLLFLPVTQGVTKFASESDLRGYTDPIPDKPVNYVYGFFDKSLQHWAEKYFNVNLGFRAFLIRSLNQINFTSFRESNNSHLKVISTKHHGLYSNLSINSLNDELIHKTVLEKRYQDEAKKLLQVQKILQSQGKYFEVVIASSKAYVYPDELGNRYLAGGAVNVFSRAPSYGQILKAAGVHVVDSGPLLRQVAQSGFVTHPASGLHWSYYAGCLVAQQILEDARQYSPSIAPILNCGAAVHRKPFANDIDLDGYYLLNIWSRAGLIKQSTYPTIMPVKNVRKRPSILFIGDSFSDHIRNAFKMGDVYSRIIMSSYFQRREIEDRLDNKINTPTEEEDSVFYQKKILEDIATSDIIVLEMVDYNVSRCNYGFADAFLASVPH